MPYAGHKQAAQIRKMFIDAWDRDICLFSNVFIGRKDSAFLGMEKYRRRYNPLS
jgi:hypothetical protein